MNKEIEHLNWDSNLFGYKVGKISLKIDEDENKINFPGNSKAFKLIYIFSEKALDEEFCRTNNASLVDIKVELVKILDHKTLIDAASTNIIQLSSLNNALLDLVFQSGTYSRFKIDSKFVANEFEKLYQIWIENSLKSENTLVFGYIINNELLGFQTLLLNDKEAEIGLIAVDANNRGTMIGKKMLNFACNSAIEKGIHHIKVSTQKHNEMAMNFYLKNGFVVVKNTYIYHIWQ
ncbi:MAG TPA: GNAT family N-acetyltransferase [Bacteroidia bacterium]|nr:GNAT family N-acetyltransferase [Bacteroidia bacterium]